MKLCDARILFVDDEPILLEIFAAWASGETSHRITTAADGQEALEKLATNDYDLLITDVNMPRVNGPELVRRMAVMGKTPPSIVFVSGFGDINEREMYGLGVEAFLSKPVRRDTLLTAIEQALAERSDLWQKPMDIPPRHSLSIKALDFFDSANGGHMALGRGGFSAPYSSPVALGKVNFDCQISVAGLRLTGQGYLRWKSKIDSTIGIEIAYIDESCRSVVVDEINKTRPIAFIPSN